MVELNEERRTFVSFRESKCCRELERNHWWSVFERRPSMRIPVHSKDKWSVRYHQYLSFTSLPRRFFLGALSSITRRIRSSKYRRFIRNFRCITRNSCWRWKYFTILNGTSTTNSSSSSSSQFEIFLPRTSRDRKQISSTSRSTFDQNVFQLFGN